MKKFIFGCLLLLLGSFPSMAADDVEGLIDKVKTEESAWADSEGDLPPVKLLGSAHAIQIYSPANEATHSNYLCTAVEFDELLGLEKDVIPPQETVLNTKLPRVRDSLSESCLVRPGDPILAIGPGWQELVVVKDFIVRRENPVCPNDAPYSLWVTYDGARPEDPFFFSTDIELPSASNEFKFIDQYDQEPLDEKMKALLAKEIQFSDEYEATIYKISSPNCDRLLYVKKKTVSPEDAGLASEAIISEKSGVLQTLMMEQIDSSKASGHLKLEGILDFDGDNNADLLLEGDHQGCLYQELFKGQTTGFEKQDLPNRPCAC